jgi:hypothetical protein
MGGIFWLAEKLLASQEGLCSMELVTSQVSITLRHKQTSVKHTKHGYQLLQKIDYILFAVCGSSNSLRNEYRLKCMSGNWNNLKTSSQSTWGLLQLKVTYPAGPPKLRRYRLCAAVSARRGIRKMWAHSPTVILFSSLLLFVVLLLGRFTYLCLCLPADYLTCLN